MMGTFPFLFTENGEETSHHFTPCDNKSLSLCEAYSHTDPFRFLEGSDGHFKPLLAMVKGLHQCH